MTIFVVARKSDQAEITRYAAQAPVEQIDDLAVPFSEFDHVEVVEGEPYTPVTAMTWIKLEYLRRFTQEERIAIRAAAKQVPQLEDYLALLEVASEVRSDDPDIVAALAMLEAGGWIGAGRAAEILGVA